MASNTNRSMLFGRVKSLDAILATAEKHSLHRSLGAFQLTLLGIGAVIGTGIFGYERMGDLMGVAVFIALPSVVLMMMFGQTRIFFVMARDGLLPERLSAVHPRFRTPHVVTAVTGVVVTIAAAFFPVGRLADYSNAGTLFAFAMVAISVLVLRRTDPGRNRPFRVPALGDHRAARDRRLRCAIPVPTADRATRAGRLGRDRTRHLFRICQEPESCRARHDRGAGARTGRARFGRRRSAAGSSCAG